MSRTHGAYQRRDGAPGTAAEVATERRHGAAGTADNLADLLLRHAADTPGNIAVRQGARSVSYAELDRAVRDTSAALHHVGVRPADRVALLFPNDHRFIEALLAVIRLGAVAVPLNTRSGVTALSHVVADCTARVIVAHASLAERAGDLANDRTAAILLTDGEHGWAVRRTGSTDPVPLPVLGERAVPVYPVAADDICLQPYTSGSTGLPKGCLLTHGGQHWNAATVRDGWRLSSADRGLVTAPLYHKNAMICVVKPLLLAGGTVVVGETSDPAGIPREVERHGCTYTTGVPATYQLLLDSGEHRRRDISSLRFVICGSAPLSDEFGSRISRELGVPVLEAYGLTEGGPQVLMTPRDSAPRYGRAGTVMPGGEVRLLDVEDMPPDGVTGCAEVGVDAVGELWVRNPGVTRGYVGLPDVTRKRISRDGWLRTGDLASRDADGWFRVLGRRDDMLNVAGENVYPTEVERLILALPEVRQAVVVPVPHATKGQVPVAFVKADGLSESDIREHCLAKGAAHAHPRRVWFLDEFPVGGTGKLDRAWLVREAERRYAAEGSPA